MKHHTAPSARRNVRAYAAAFLSYLLLVGQLTPLALAANSRTPRVAPPTDVARESAGEAPRTEAAAVPAPLAAPAAPAAAFVSNITATKTDAFPDPNGDGKADPGETITYTITITNNGPDAATNLTLNDNVDANTNIVAGSAVASPIAIDDTATAFGNVRISTANGAANLLANDNNPNTGNTTGLTLTAQTKSSANCTGSCSNNVVINADGTFTYNPPPGYTGSDTFTYTVTSANGSDTGTMTVTVGPTLVWFIDNSQAANGDGRLGTPFNSIANFNAGAADDPGDIIFLYNGTGTYTGGITLLNTQKLIGQGFSLQTETGAPPTGSDALPAAGSTPTINNPGSNIITLGQNNTLRGFNTGNSGSSGTDISGASFGTLTVSALSITGDGRALNLTTGTLNATVGGITASNTGSNDGLTLNAVGGSLTVSGSTGITNPGGAGINISNAPASTSYNFGTSTVSKNATGAAVTLSSNNATATTAFSSLAITNSVGVGLSANNGGTLNATTGSISTTGAGAAVSLTGTALGLTFTSVSSNNGANGLLFSGGTGSFTSGTTTAQNSTGIGISMANSAVAANFGNTTVSSSGADAVDLSTNSGNITFADLDMTPDPTFRGLDAQNNTGTITVSSGDITTSGGANANAVFVDGPAGRTPINLTFTTVTTAGAGNTTNLAGVSLIDASGTKFQVTGTTQINTRAGHGVFVDNTTTTTIQFATVNVPNPNAAGGDGFHVEDTSSAVTVASATISDANRTTAQNDGNTDFVPDNDGDGNGIFLRGNAGGSFTLNGGTISNSGNDGIDVRDSQNMVLSNVTISAPGLDEAAGSTGSGGHGIQAYNLTSTNTITNSVITDWEQAARHGIIWNNHSATAATLTIHGSTFSNSAAGAAAIFTTARDNANMTLNVGGTSAGHPCTFSELDAFAIISNAGDNAGSTATINTNIRNNTFTNVTEKGNNAVAARNAAGGKAIIVVSGNTFDGGGRTGADTAGMIDIGGDALDAGNFMHFTVTNNIIRNIGDNIAGSCGGTECHGKRAIDVFLDDNTVIGNDSNTALDADDTVLIDGNVITNVQRTGIQFDIGQVYNGSNIAAKITNNRVGIRADNTIDRVGKGDALNPGGEWSILVENRSQNVKSLNILVQNNLFYNGNGGTGSTLNGSGMLMRSQREGEISGTVTGNTFNVNMSSAAFGINAGTVNTGTPVLCLDASGNTIAAPGGGINLAEAVGTLNVEQASQAALSAANGGASVVIATGTPGFGTACSAPPAAPDTTELEGLPDTTDPAPASGNVVVPRSGEETTPERPFASLARVATAQAVAPVIVQRRGSAARPAAGQTRKTQTKSPAGADEPKPAPAAPAAPPIRRDAPATKTSARNDGPGLNPPVINGDNITWNIGTLPAGASVTVTFQVKVDDPYSGGPDVSNQGTVSSDGNASVLTDDPGVAGANNPTLTPILSNNVFGRDGKAPEPASGTSQLLFTFALATPATGAVTVNFSTADGGATPATGGADCNTPGVDYVSVVGGSAVFGTGEQLRTVPVTICSDANAEPDETFLLNLTGATGAAILDNQATGTITVNTPGTLLISELRTFGPGGSNDPNDEFIELYNNSDSPLTVTASDASAGYGVFTAGTCNAVPTLLGTVPNGTVIPARGHYLLTGSAYSLANYGGTGAAAGNLTIAGGGIASNANVAVFSTSDLTQLSTVNRLDAVGFTGNTGGAVCDLLHEGGTTPPVVNNLTSLGQYSILRDPCGKGGDPNVFGPCPTTGNPKDSNANESDFFFVDPNGTNATGVQRLGAAGPENMASPVRRDATISVALIDASVPAPGTPNRVRDTTQDIPNNSAFGTLSIRRRFTNQTGGNVTRLRFRIVDISTFASNNADLRARTAPASVAVMVNDPATCGAKVPAETAPCSINLLGTTLEEPPAQPNGGGFNSTLAAGTITTGSPLANGASINLQFLLGVQQTGNFKFYFIIEALP